MNQSTHDAIRADYRVVLSNKSPDWLVQKCTGDLSQWKTVGYGNTQSEAERYMHWLMDADKYPAVHDHLPDAGKKV